MENELFLLVMLNTELVASKKVTVNNHSPYSTKLFGGLNEKVCLCLFILNSNVSCGFILFAKSTCLYAF